MSEAVVGRRMGQGVISEELMIVANSSCCCVAASCAHHTLQLIHGRIEIVAAPAARQGMLEYRCIMRCTISGARDVTNVEA